MDCAIFTAFGVLFLSWTKPSSALIQHLVNQSVCYHRDDITPNTTFAKLWRISDHRKHSWLKTTSPRLSSRVAWYLMQFNKFSIVGRDVELSERFMVWDGDVIPLAPESWLLSDGKDALCSKAKQTPKIAVDVMKKVLGQKMALEKNPYYVCGMQIFRKSVVTDIIRNIEFNLGGSFPLNIFNLLQSPQGYWSEFQTYGLWVTHYQPDMIRSTPTLNFLRNPKELRKDGTCCPKWDILHKYALQGVKELVWEEHKFRVDSKCNSPLNTSSLPAFVRVNMNWSLAIMSDFQFAALLGLH